MTLGTIILLIIPFTYVKGSFEHVILLANVGPIETKKFKWPAQLVNDYSGSLNGINTHSLIYFVCFYVHYFSRLLILSDLLFSHNSIILKNSKFNQRRKKFLCDHFIFHYAILTLITI